MAIPSVKLPLPYATGLAEKTDSRYTEPGQLTGITNGVFFKRGSIRKRFGHQALSRSTVADSSFSSGKKLGKLRNILTLIDGHKYLSYDSSLDRWSDLDRIPELNAWRDPIVEWPLSVSNFDIAYGDDHIIAVYTACTSSSATNNSVFATVIEASTGNVVYANRLIIQTPATNYTSARVITVTNGSTTYAIIFYMNGTTGTDLSAITLNLSTMVFGSAQAIITDFDAAADDVGTWDVAPVVGATAGEWVMVYPRDTAGTRSAKLIKGDTTLLPLIANTTYGPPVGHNNPLHAAAICANSGENIWTSIGWDSGANTAIHIRASNVTTLAAILAETTLGVTITGTASFKMANVRMSSTSVRTVWAAGGSAVGIRWGDMNTAGTASLTTRQMFQCDLVHKPFVVDGRVYVGAASLVTLVATTAVPAVSTTARQGAYWLCDITGDGTTDQQPARPCSVLGPRVANTVGSPASANLLVSGAWAISSTRWLSIGSFAGVTSTRYSLQQLVYNFADDTYPRWQHAEIGDAVFVSGSVLMQFDSGRVQEVGFFHPPPTISIASSNGAGALTPNATYDYACWYEFVDGRGQIQRSAATFNTVTLGAADDTTTTTVTNLAVTTKQDIESSFNPVVSVRLARTTPGNSVYYLLVGDAAAPASLPNTLTQNITDLTSDAALPGLGFGTYWAAGGVLEGYQPPGLLIIVAHNNRIVGVGDDRISLFWSTEYSTNTAGEQVRFNDLLRVVVAEGGPITALASMDGQLYVFKQKAIYVISGNGWNETGTQNDLSVPRALATDQGAIDQRGILTTHQGTFFVSKAGIQLLDRGGNIRYIGAPVEDKLIAYPIVRSVALYSRAKEIRWECSATETASTGITLVYNFEFDAWSAFLRTETDTPTSEAVAVSNIDCGDRFYWLSTTGRTYLEHIDSTATRAFYDDTAWVTFSLETCWAKGSGINGWQRWRYVSFVNELKTPADITLSVGFDYDTDYLETHTFAANDQSVWTTFLKEAQYQIGNQKSESIRVKIADSPPSGMAPGTGQGSVYIGLVLDVAALPGRKRLGPTQSA